MTRFDIIEAYFCYVVDYHGGAASKEYALTNVFSRLKFRPSINLNADNLTPEGRVCYDYLVATGGSGIRDRRAARQPVLFEGFGLLDPLGPDTDRLHKAFNALTPTERLQWLLDTLPEGDDE